MKLIITNLFLVFFFILPFNAQQLNEVTNTVSKSLKTVKSNKKEYVQTIETLQPTVVRVTVEEIDNKGKTSRNAYEFNPADIKESSLRKVVKKDLIYVQLEIKNTQKLIKRTVDDEKTSYINSFKIYAEDVNNARTLEGVLKETIPIARQITEQRISFSSYSEYLNWLENNLNEVSFSEKQYHQKLKENTSHIGSIKIIQNISKEKSAKEYIYKLNLFSLNPNSISYKATGEVINVYLETNKALKIIENFEDGEKKNYINKFSIACKSIEQARDMKKVLQAIIPIAKQTFNQEITPITSQEDGFMSLNKLINKVTVSGQTFTQNFKGECVTDFNQETESIDQTEQINYNFSFTDIDKHRVNYNSKGKFLYVDVFTKADEPFIKRISNGEDNKYLKTIRIYVSSIENAVILKQTLVDVVNLCSGNDTTVTTNTTDNTPTNTNTSTKVVNKPISTIKKETLTYKDITIEEPSFMGQIFYVDNNEQVDLEEGMYYLKKGSSAGKMITGIGKVKATLVVDGKSSLVKIAPQEKLFFVCNYGSNDILPSKIIQILKFEVKKRTREYLVSSASNVSGQTESNKFSFVKFKARKYGEQSYLIEFNNLEPGEYGFSIGGDDSGKEVYLFNLVE